MVYRRSQMYTVASPRTETKKPKMTKEEVFLLDELSKQTGTGVFFHVNAVAVALLPLWTFSRILGMDVEYYLVRVTLVTFVTAVMLWFACNEFRTAFKGRFKKKAKKAIPEVKDDKKPSSKLDKTSIALLKTDKSDDGEASGFSLFYTNCYFLSLVLLFGHVGFRQMSVENNYAVSMVLAGAIVTILAATMMGKK